MSVATFEGVVEDGQIRLESGVRLPDHTRVYVLVPEAGMAQVARVATPRLAHPEQAGDFRMDIVEGPADAGV
ncbi:MAG: hypothetical protein HY906_01830 [Deltaproteobacteria bacterium]|nr:hypothetical protein [Deltaproteobacteria bacterium]